MVLGTVCGHVLLRLGLATRPAPQQLHREDSALQATAGEAACTPRCFCTQDCGALPSKTHKTLPAARRVARPRSRLEGQQRPSLSTAAFCPGCAPQLRPLGPLFPLRGSARRQARRPYPRPEARRAAREAPRSPPPGREPHLAAGRPAPPRPRVPLAAWAGPGRAGAGGSQPRRREPLPPPPPSGAPRPARGASRRDAAAVGGRGNPPPSPGGRLCNRSARRAARPDSPRLGERRSAAAGADGAGG